MAAKTGTKTQCLSLIDTIREDVERDAIAGPLLGLLTDALQFTKERRLAHVESGNPFQALVDSCDGLIEKSTKLGDLERMFFVECGVRYIGEICYVTPSTRRDAARLRSAKRKLGFPEWFNPLASNWYPHYWSDQKFFAALGSECVTFFGDYGATRITQMSQGYWRSANRLPFAWHRTFARQIRTTHYMVNFLARSGCAPLATDVLRERQQHLEGRGLWAGALIPTNFNEDLKQRRSAPTPAWDAEQRRIEDEITRYETPNAWVVETRRDGTHWLHPVCNAMPDEQYPGTLPGTARCYLRMNGKVMGMFEGGIACAVEIPIDSDHHLSLGNRARSARAFSAEARARSYCTKRDMTLNVVP